MVPGPVEAAKLIQIVIAVDSPPRLAREVLTDIIIQNGWFSGNEAVDRADYWLIRFIKRAEFIIRSNREAGSYVSFTFNSSGSDYLQGSCYPEPTDPEDVVKAKLRRSQTYYIYEHCRSLKPAQIEQLCGRILELLKVEKPFVSRQSADQGIDFFGRVPYGKI